MPPWREVPGGPRASNARAGARRRRRAGAVDGAPARWDACSHAGASGSGSKAGCPLFSVLRPVPQELEAAALPAAGRLRGAPARIPRWLDMGIKTTQEAPKSSEEDPQEGHRRLS